jgi:phosphoribosyl-ATP pyrophosphohydrolase
MADAVDRLYEAAVAAMHRDPAFSRTAKLFRDGIDKMAKKLAEEAVETGIEAIRGKTVTVVQESADVMYQLCVLWAAMGIRPSDVWNEMDRRERLYGIAEKLPKSALADKDDENPVNTLQARLRTV